MKKNSVTGRNNIVANRDVHNIFQMQAINQEVELGVINEIFDFVIKEAKYLDLDESKKAFTSDRLIHIVKKISINFCEKDEIVG
jgi:hypothetical protein